MNDPRRVPFGEIAWTEAAPGIRARETDVGGTWGPEASREDWCEEGHRGFVVEDEIEYRFDDGRELLQAGEGEAFLLPPAPLGGERTAAATLPNVRHASYS